MPQPGWTAWQNYNLKSPDLPNPFGAPLGYTIRVGRVGTKTKIKQQITNNSRLDHNWLVRQTNNYTTHFWREHDKHASHNNETPTRRIQNDYKSQLWKTQGQYDTTKLHTPGHCQMGINNARSQHMSLPSRTPCSETYVPRNGLFWNTVFYNLGCFQRQILSLFGPCGFRAPTRENSMP